ncbi:MAG: pyridoxamine 5'-phosphate oxidase family protein [Thermoplasmatales archaeon]|nr:pyridoxamine 5'-phosphate oxidase family protein [Thermoplasmatales archaeon]
MEDIKEEIVNYLSKRKFMTLATTQKDKPLTHPVAYVNKGPILYFSTSNQTRKARSIKENPNVAFSVYERTEHLDEIINIQMEGEATIVANKEETEEILEMLKLKFPTMADLTIDSDNIIIKITPKICHFTDYTKGFGYRERVEY